MPQKILELRDQFVAAAGEPGKVTVEREADDSKNDHVWIAIQAGEFGTLHVAISTQSRYSNVAGSDPRVRVGLIKSTWAELPSAGIRLTTGLNYAAVEAEHTTTFVTFERPVLEEMLVDKTRRAIFVEAWGELYVRAHVGVHQVHSRRASFAVRRDLIGRDGALRFYFRSPNQSEMLLFKFAGQP
ncbi:MAG TPA: hypothetical protein VGM62_12935 [Chthoniobacterales bacterium]